MLMDVAQLLEEALASLISQTYLAMGHPRIDLLTSSGAVFHKRQLGKCWIKLKEQQKFLRQQGVRVVYLTWKSEIYHLSSVTTFYWPIFFDPWKQEEWRRGWRREKERKRESHFIWKTSQSFGLQKKFRLLWAWLTDALTTRGFCGTKL